MKIFLLLFLSSRAWSRETVFYIISGGGEPTSHHARYERDVRIFDELFGGKATILNAGGRGSLHTTTENGSFRRDPEGRLVLVPSELKKETLQAGRAEVETLFKNLKGESITGYLGDHGNREGLTLWGWETLKGKSYRDWLQSLPADTVARAVVGSCYPGVMLVDPQRSPPLGISAWPNYLKLQFPVNKCGLASGKEDELTESLGGNGTYEESPLKDFLERHPKPSLQEMKQFFYARMELRSTPVLTSDYLVEDLLKQMCVKEPQPAGFEIHTESTTTPAAAPLTGPCDPKIREEKVAHDKELQVQDETYQQAKEMYLWLLPRFLAKQWPEESQAYENAVRKIEFAQRTAVLNLRSKPGIALTAGGDTLLQEERDAVLEYGRLWESVRSGKSRRKEFMAFAQGPVIQREIQNPTVQSRFPLFFSALAGLRNAPLDYLTVQETAVEKALAAQSARRKFLQLHQQAAREFVENELKKHADWAEVKKVYDSIRKCETTPIN